MGQMRWVGACAIAGLLAGASWLAAQEHPAGDPFAAKGQAPTKVVAETHEKGAADAKTADAKADKDARSAPASYSPADAERRIERALNQPLHTPLSFMQQPLSQVASVLSEEYEIPIQFDTPALDAVAVTPDVEVTINIANVSLKNALRLMLQNAGAEQLTYIVDKEVLLITTQEQAEKRLEVHVYRVDDLVVADRARSVLDPGADYDSLIDTIVSTVEHDTWMENGTGQGEVKAFPPGMLVISTTRKVHQQVQELLDTLRETKSAVEENAKVAAKTAEVHPVTRVIPLRDSELTSADNRKILGQSLQRSVNWNVTDANVSEEEVFLQVLPNQVLVRHLPSVVGQVEAVIRELTSLSGISGGSGRSRRNPQAPGGGSGGGGRGGQF
jgi:hypothetical protein